MDHRSEQRHQEVLDLIRAAEWRSRRSIPAALELEAGRSSAQLVLTEMMSAKHHALPHELLREALREAPTDGMILEFGVATGNTLGVIVDERPGQPTFGFDSFQGLPERWREGFDAGEFTMEPPQVDGADLIIGWFEDTLPKFLYEHEGSVGFLHVDCDLYSSTKTVLDLVGERLVPGTVVVFDEYFNYPGWQQHEYRAWKEYVARTGTEFEYLGLSMDDEQVSLRVTRAGSAERR